MSTLILIGIPIVVATAVVLSKTDIPEIIKEVVAVLIRTTNYTADKIAQIISYYYPVC